MAISEAFTGTETVGTTEWSLTTDTSGPDAETSDGVFQAYIDINALAAGDDFRLRLYEKCQSGSTQRLAEEWTLTIAVGKLLVTPAFVLLHGWDFTLVKVAGTDRAIDWSIRKIA